jgi:MalT-like TPR region
MIDCYAGDLAVVEQSAQQMLALHWAGRPEGAEPVLDQALQMAEPLGLVRTFVDGGP